MGDREVVARTIERLLDAIAWLGQGVPGVECSDLAAMLRDIVEQLSTREAAIAPDLLERVRHTLSHDGLDQAGPEWCAAALAGLRDIWQALAAPEESLLGDDAFARYSATYPVDDGDVQYADSFELPELAGADAGITPDELDAACLPEEPMRGGEKQSGRPGGGGGKADLGILAVGGPHKTLRTHAKPPEVPRMAGSLSEAGPVKLGAAAPAACRPGGEFTASFVAYPPGAEAEVADMLHKLSARSAPHLGLADCAWKIGTRAQVSLSGKGLAIDPPEQELVWQGERILLNFDVAVPDDAVADTIVLKFDVDVDGFRVARLRLDLEIGADTAATRVAQAEAARTAFASYSSRDRQRVLDRVAALQIDTGMDIFLDCLSLHPGQHWEARLAEEIRRRELFLLFWSEPAAHSQWVEWEWRRALAEGKKDAMEIHPLENGVMPPPELGDLHFADPAMAVRAAGAAPS